MLWFGFRANFLFLLVVVCGLFKSATALAYTEFIAFGFSSCLHCHVNPTEGSLLTVKGEKWKSQSLAIWNWQEQTGSSDQTPWFRSSLDYRGTQFNTQSERESNSDFYHQQLDLTALFQTDKEANTVFVVTYGYSPSPADYNSNRLSQFDFNQGYAKVQFHSSFLLYAGLFERAFGLPQRDRSSYQRAFQGFTHQINFLEGPARSLGINAHIETQEFIIDLNPFFGNPKDQENFRHKGGSLKVEYALTPKDYLGLSVSSSKSEFEKKEMASIHLRKKAFKDSAFLGELGTINNNLDAGSKIKNSYGFLEFFTTLRPGVFPRFWVEQFRSELPTDTLTYYRYAGGLRLFPTAFFDSDLDIIRETKSSSSRSLEQNWIAQVSLHLGL